MSINLVENFAVTQARAAVRDSLQAHGEMCIVLSMYNRFDTGDLPMCPYCTDDIYTTSGEACSICWGTGVQGGVKQSVKVWGLFTDAQAREDYRKHGVWQPDFREFQTEAFPLLRQHDYLIRIAHWDDDGTPALIDGFYGIKEVTRDSLRTGSRFGQSHDDVVGQRAQISKLSEITTIAAFPVIGVSFESASPTVPQPIPLTLLSSPAPPAKTVHAYTIGDGESTTCTINHYLGTTDILVQLYDAATGEQVDTNIEASTISSVTLKFQDPPAPNGIKVVIGA